MVFAPRRCTLGQPGDQRWAGRLGMGGGNPKGGGDCGCEVPGDVVNEIIGLGKAVVGSDEGGDAGG